MTNSEYESASIAAANAAVKFEGEHKLKQCDKAIAVLEESLARLQAERREIVNRYDLNRRKGGPLQINKTYVVGEHGPECSNRKDDDQHAHMVD